MNTPRLVSCSLNHVYHVIVTSHSEEMNLGATQRMAGEVQMFLPENNIPISEETHPNTVDCAELRQMASAGLGLIRATVLPVTVL